METKLTRPVLAKEKCERCGGAGREVNQKQTGARMQGLRLAANLKQIDVARKMGVTDGYVSDLELGKRSWSAALIEAYRQAVM